MEQTKLTAQELKTKIDAGEITVPTGYTVVDAEYFQQLDAQNIDFIAFGKKVKPIFEMLSGMDMSNPLAAIQKVGSLLGGKEKEELEAAFLKIQPHLT